MDALIVCISVENQTKQLPFSLESTDFEGLMHFNFRVKRIQLLHIRLLHKGSEPNQYSRDITLTKRMYNGYPSKTETQALTMSYQVYHIP